MYLPYTLVSEIYIFSADYFKSSKAPKKDRFYFYFFESIYVLKNLGEMKNEKDFLVQNEVHEFIHQLSVGSIRIPYPFGSRINFADL